jgi:hypothetical protein
MADSVLFVGWGGPVRGREEQAVDSFNDVVGLFGRMQQEGRVEGFDTVFLDPHGGDLGGFFLLRGSVEQMDAVRHDEDFRREFTRAQLLVDGLGFVEGQINEGIAREMEIYQEAVSAVPQLG